MGADTWLAQRNRRKASERRDADRLAAAFDTRVMARLSGELAPIFVANGVGAVDRSSELAEKHRVQAIIGRDIADRAAEKFRKQAEMELADGVFVNLTDTVLPPTPEWLAKHDVVAFTPKQPDATVRVVKSVRRVVTPIVARMHYAGRITDDQFKACMWFRHVFDMAGVEGRFTSSQFSDGGSRRSEVGYSGHIPTTLNEAAARHELRLARGSIPAAHLKFFESVVAHDIPVSRAWRFSRVAKHKAEAHFHALAEKLAVFCRNMDVNLSLVDKS